MAREAILEEVDPEAAEVLAELGKVVLEDSYEEIEELLRRL